MNKAKKTQIEFIALMASLMSLVAFAIDALLPALGEIGKEIGITHSNDNQLLITMMFLGLGIGQLVSGPLSDSLGRKPVIYYGLVLFIFASFLSTVAPSLELMIFSRILQGIALSAPRTISMAIVRDSFRGDYMARIMSFVTMIFIMVPAIAPAFGKILLDMFGWESIFYNQIFITIVVVLWFWARQPETLNEKNKIHFNYKLLLLSTREFFKYKQAVLYTLLLGLLTGSFMVFLSASQKIFVEQYGMFEEFPYLFASIAIAVGISTLLNGLYVEKIGMKKLVLIFTIIFSLIPFVYILLLPSRENPPISLLLVFLILQFITIGFLFGNISAIAMEPVGHIAGMASALIGFLSTIFAVPIAAFIGSFIDVTAFPMFVGFFVTGIISSIFLLYRNEVLSSKVLIRKVGNKSCNA